MKLTEKIEAIRKQPDHIRLRWVWGGVAFSMFIILAIWIFSITVMFKSGKNNTTQNATDSLVSELKNQTEEIEQQTKSLKNFSENISQIETKSSSTTSEIDSSNQSQQYTDLENHPK